MQTPLKKTAIFLNGAVAAKFVLYDAALSSLAIQIKGSGIPDPSWTTFSLLELL